MIISLIVAVSRNGVIGKKNKLPWHLSSDLKRFKEITMGKPVIMGRKTFESIGKPLPGRLNIILTCKKEFQDNEVKIAGSVEDALSLVDDHKEVMIIGGDSVYRQFLPIVSRIYLTLIEAEIEGDSFFPDINQDDWIEIFREQHSQDDKNDHSYTFLVYEKRKINSN